MFNFKISILFSLFIFAGCISQPKVERDAHGSIIREDRLEGYKDSFQKLETAKGRDTFGWGQYSKKCSGIGIAGNARNPIRVFETCDYGVYVHLKFQCELTQVIGEPYYWPLRYKELKINIVNFDRSILKDQKRLPTTVATDHEGVINLSFDIKESLKEPLRDYQIEITDPKSQLMVTTDRISQDPIVAPEPFCQK